MAAPMRQFFSKFSSTYKTFLRDGQRRAAHRKTVSTIDIALKRPEEYKDIVVKGWVKSVQNHKKTTFLHLNDGSTNTNLQIVGKPETIPDGVKFGSCVRVEGELVESQASGQNVEVHAKRVRVIGACDPADYPFKAGVRHPADYTRQFPHLRARTRTFSSLLRIRNNATDAVHTFMKEEGFCHIHTPIFTSTNCEGPGELFSVCTDIEPPVGPPDGAMSLSEHRDWVEDMRSHFFQTPTNLAVSGQLHLESVANAFSRVYTFGPSFRAELSRTRHHLAEFYMVEAEMAFIDNLDELMDFIETLIKTTTSRIIAENANDVKLFYEHISPDHEHILAKLLTHEFIRMPYADVMPILLENNSSFDLKAESGADLNKEHERFITKHFGNVPVFVTNFPTHLKPFYAKRNDDNRTVAAVDLLVPQVGELVGGSLREHDYTKLENTLQELELIDKLDWYLDVRKYGSAPHGGFGLGFERYIQYLLGIANIRDTIPFPRWAGSCKL